MGPAVGEFSLTTELRQAPTEPTLHGMLGFLPPTLLPASIFPGGADFDKVTQTGEGVSNLIRYRL